MCDENKNVNMKDEKYDNISEYIIYLLNNHNSIDTNNINDYKYKIKYCNCDYCDSDFTYLTNSNSSNQNKSESENIVNLLGKKRKYDQYHYLC